MLAAAKRVVWTGERKGKGKEGEERNALIHLEFEASAWMERDIYRSKTVIPGNAFISMLLF